MYSATLICSQIRSAATLRERIVAKGEGALVATEPAFCAITDFDFDFPITVDSDASIEDAVRDMARLGIHALLVIRRGLREINPQVVGLITAYEIERACPASPPKSADAPARTALSVCDLMTPWEELSCVKYDSLRGLTVKDLYEMFQGTGLSHILVVEAPNDDVAVARGVLSRATLARSLRPSRGAPCSPGSH